MTVPLDISGLGIMAELDDGDQIIDAVVLLRTANPATSRDGFVIANTPGMSWLVQMGMVTAATVIVNRIDEAEGDD